MTLPVVVGFGGAVVGSVIPMTFFLMVVAVMLAVMLAVAASIVHHFVVVCGASVAAQQQLLSGRGTLLVFQVRVLTALKTD